MHHKTKLNSEETDTQMLRGGKNTGFEPKCLGSQGFEQSADRW